MQMTNLQGPLQHLLLKREIHPTDKDFFSFRRVRIEYRHLSSSMFDPRKEEKGGGGGQYQKRGGRRKKTRRDVNQKNSPSQRVFKTGHLHEYLTTGVRRACFLLFYRRTDIPVIQRTGLDRSFTLGVRSGPCLAPSASSSCYRPRDPWTCSNAARLVSVYKNSIIKKLLVLFVLTYWPSPLSKQASGHSNKQTKHIPSMSHSDSISITILINSLDVNTSSKQTTHRGLIW